MADNPQDGDDEEKKDEVPDPYALPEKHKKYINETEYDELKHLFQKYDEDLSGAIDATEMMGVLGDIGVEFDHAGASDLLKKLDTDGSGVLEFNEFLEFIVGIKRGDAWLSDFSGLAERAGETPMGALEKQGQRQGFTVAFRLAESRETVGETYTTFECVLTGRWYEVGEGGGGGAAVAREGARRFVGTGRSVREAKVAAAQAALKQLTAHMPGSDYPPGEIPDKWQAWVVTNIKRGVPPATLLSTLLVKGFFPARCPRLMHRLIAYVSLEALRARHPRPVVEDRLVPAWFNWTETWLKLGVGGEVLVEVLQDHGVVISEHKRLQQRLQRSIRHADMFQEEGAVPVSPDGRRDWFTAVEEGSLWEVRLYIQAGQEVDREERVPRSPVPRFALALAAGLGHLEIMNLLLESGARVNRAGYAGRTALHAACRRGRAAAAARLLDHGADVHLPDRYGNTALHEAARANHPAIVELLAAHEEENVRQVLSGNLVVSDAGPLGGVMARAFDDLMAANLPEHEKPRFHKAWIYQVVDYCWSQIRDTEKHRIGLPPKWLIDDMMKRFDANPDYGFWKGEKTKEKYIPLFEKPDEVVLIMSHCFRQMFLDARNNLGRTALMEACAEDLACSHAAVVRGLCEGHYVNLLLRDCQGRRALELLGTVERRRPGTPSGTGLREEMLIENRDELIFDLREEDRKKKEQEQAQHRENVIKRYMQEARELDPRLWQYVKGHWPVRRALGGWQEREDPDTGNLCYLRDYGASEHEGKRRPERYYHDAEECVFSWEKPPGFAREEKLQQAWSVVRVRSTFVRAVGAWDILRDGPSGCEFYCRREDDGCRLDAPEEAAWDAIMESSEKLWVSDYSGWEARKDASGNSFWRHPDKGYRWDRPGDAVEPEIFAEMDDDHVQEMKEHAAAQDRDLARLARADARRPFRLAYVPRAYAHAPSRAKRLQGWHLCRMEDGWDPRLNHGWWLLEDVEQPLVEEVQAGSKVLCRREGMVGWHDGIIKQKRGKGGHFLVVAFSEWDVVPDICPADYRLPGRPFHFHPDTFAAGWGPDPPPPPPGGSPPSTGANLGFPPLSGEEWDDFGAMGRLRREVTYQWEEWEDMETGCLYWRHRARHEAQSAARRVQRLFRRRKCRPAPLRWETDAYTFEKPEAVREEELKRNGWATLLRRSQVTGHLFDEDGEKWDELFDPHEEERWYHCRDVGRSQWDKPPEKQDPDKSKAEEVEREFLEVGEKVWFVFPHHQKESVGIIIRVRIDPFTNLRSYDVARDGINEVAIKMVRRGLLTRMVQTEEERQQELEERKWRQEYIEGKAKADRAKQRRKEEEVAAHRAAMRGGLKEYARRELGKEEALALADLRRRIEEDMLAETAEVDEELLAITRRLEELQRPPTGRLLKKEMQRRAAEAMELSLAKVRRDRDDRIEAQRQAREAELRYKTWLEARMKDHEEGISTPRTSNRRKLLRTVQLAMLRQTEGFMICEWGCKEWLHAGADVVLHTTQLCVKRLLPCVLGRDKEAPKPLLFVLWCGEQQREEVWLAPPAAQGQGPGTTYQQFHEEVECPCRLVPCPRKCGEWVKRNELGHHMAELCVKRPFPGLKCRLGCGAVFEGGHHRMLQCEEERVEHEREECPHRLVRCMWDDCGRMIEACKRKEHKEEHIMSLGIAVFNLANIEGFHKYKVTGGATQLKVLAWGGGGGSGGGVGRHAGAGGGGAFVEALVAVNPGDILKILVGGGGGAGVFATPSAELGYGAFDVGVALGGYPGGGNGHGGNDLWAAGGGGGYSFLQIQPRDGVETETVLVAAGGGGGGSRDGVPGGGLRGELSGTKIDKRNGRLGTASGPGEGGDSGDVASTRFPAENGRAWSSPLRRSPHLGPPRPRPAPPQPTPPSAAGLAVAVH